LSTNFKRKIFAKRFLFFLLKQVQELEYMRVISTFLQYWKKAKIRFQFFLIIHNELFDGKKNHLV